jgi:hypothetical protein
VSRALVPPHQAIDQMREADVRWKAALGGLASYPARLRTLAEAADEQSRALTLAHLANVEWKPRPGASNLRFPVEVQESSGRPGPPETWSWFDDAVKQLGVALEGDSMKRIADAFEGLSALAAELADSLEGEERTEGHRQTG